MRVAIYHNQHKRGDCKACAQTYINSLTYSSMQCQDKAKSIYGYDCEFSHYTDLGDYPSDSLERPFLKRMLADVKNGKVDAVIVFSLSAISSDFTLLLEVYRILKEHHVELLTYLDGKKAGQVLDEALEKGITTLN